MANPDDHSGSQLRGQSGPCVDTHRLAAAAVALVAVILAAITGCSPSVDPGQSGAVSAPDEVNTTASPNQAAETAGDGHQFSNRLVHETSPYLLQHAHNPVNWYPWGKEAFEKAKQEGKPIFLSVGYSTCYWCHVMERESFENEEVADLINEHFVAIKVDREELPDVDEQYMLATQLVTGRGGWPNSVWLTPDGRPWMAGTYFPREQFKRALATLADFWETRREDVEQQADQLAQAIRRAGNVSVDLSEQDIDQALVDRAIEAFSSSYDDKHGGFGGAPKFPPHSSLRLLMQEYRRTEEPPLLRMIDGTLDAMARGGLRDHVGGGFHRYSTDEHWLLPHFEKMLYDNAQLLRLYADGYAVTGDERYRQVADEIVEWVEREMTDPDGGFYSALDSESDGEEGRFYVWEYGELLEILGPQRGRLFADMYGIKPEGNFTEEATGERPGTNIPHLPVPLVEFAQQRNLSVESLRNQWREARAVLLVERDKRPRPHLDDKILTSWNGLMIASLAYAGRTLDEPRYVAAAERAARFLLENMVDDGRLKRIYREGEAKQPAYLTDYAFLAEALLELHKTTGDEVWLQHARRLADTLLEDFQDREAGGFYFTSAAHDELLMRSKNLTGGGNIPGGNGVAAQVLLRLGKLTGEARYSDAARRTLESLAGYMWQSPQGSESLLLAVAMVLAPEPNLSDAEPAEALPSELPSADARHEKHPVTVDLFASRLSVEPGETFDLAVALTIADGWHLYGQNPNADFLIPATVQLAAADAIKPGEVVRPSGRLYNDPVLEAELNVYEGRVWFRLPVAVAHDAEPGKTTLQVELRTQACDDSRCLPPENVSLALPITVQTEAEPGETRHPGVFYNLND